MKKKILCMIILSLILIFSLNTGAVSITKDRKIFTEENTDQMILTQTSSWYKKYDYLAGDSGHAIQPTSDGGFIIAGETHDVVYPGDSPQYWTDYEILLIKIDSDGKTEWMKSYDCHPMYDDFGRYVLETSDGGFVVFGHTDYGSGVVYKCAIQILKTDSKGNKIWNKLIDGLEYDMYLAQEAQETSDGGFICTGSLITHTEENTAKNSGLALIKFDSMGNLIWEKGLRYSDPDTSGYVPMGFSIKITNDEGYIIAGHTGTSGSDNPCAMWLIKTDKDGNIEWDKTFNDGNKYRDSAHSVEITDDGGYAIAGIKISKNQWDGWLIKTDSNGDIEWEKTFSPYNLAYIECVKQTNDGGFILAGSVKSEEKSWDLWLIKTDSNGDVEWEKQFGGTELDYGYYVQQANDGGFVIVGDSLLDSLLPNLHNIIDVLVVKTDGDGNVEENSNPIAKEFSVFIFLDRFALFKKLLKPNMGVSSSISSFDKHPVFQGFLEN